MFLSVLFVKFKLKFDKIKIGKLNNIFILQKQKDAHRKLKQMFISLQERNQRVTYELNSEKQKQKDYAVKSDDFVSLLGEIIYDCLQFRL